MKETFLWSRGLNAMIKSLVLVFVLVGFSQVGNAQTTSTSPIDATSLIAQDVDDMDIRVPADADTDYKYVKFKFYVNMAAGMKAQAETLGWDNEAVIITPFVAVADEMEAYFTDNDQDLLSVFQTVKSDVETLLSITY